MIVFILALLFAPVEKQIVYLNDANPRVIVQMDCRREAKSEIAKFMRCMQGPPYLCGPAYSPKHVPPYQYWWMNLPPSPKPYVCIHSLVECWRFDEDYDGDVDLRDLAAWLVRNYGRPKDSLRHMNCIWGELCTPTPEERVCYGWDGDVRYERDCSDPIEAP